MRFPTAAVAVCLSLSIFAAGFAGVLPVPRADASGSTAAQSPPAGAPAPGAPAPGASAPGASAPGASSGDAAEKHAKRTACLKQAKTKKLVGAEKTEFIKNCMAAP